jgi:hypothetical protein
VRRTKTSIGTAPVGSVWDEWVAAFLLEERDAKGRRARTLPLHRENLASRRRVLDHIGAPADPAALTRTHSVAARRNRAALTTGRWIPKPWHVRARTSTATEQGGHSLG